jgi:hypothetical protein
MVAGRLAVGSAGASAGLLPASPPRPAQPVRVVAGRPAGHGREEVLDLVAGQTDQPGWSRTPGVLGDRGHHQEGVRQQGQGGPAVPGAPAATWCWSRPHSPLPACRRLLYPPARPGHPHQPDQRQAGRASAHVVRQLPAGQAAAQQPALPPVRRASAVERQAGSRRISGGPWPRGRR